MNRHTSIQKASSTIATVVLCASLGRCSSSSGAAATGVVEPSAQGSGGASDRDVDGGAVAPRERPRSGMSVHVANVRIGGPLPPGPDVATDALDVQFDLEVAHFGAQNLVDVRVRDARVALSNGHAIEFEPISEGFDGRIAAGTTRQIPFRKRPNSAAPRATRALCGQWMRVELTVALGDTGRASRVSSRQVRVQCPDE